MIKTNCGIVLQNSNGSPNFAVRSQFGGAESDVWRDPAEFNA